jgi:hypothetical protein
LSRASATITAGFAAIAWLRHVVMPFGLPFASQSVVLTPAAFSCCAATTLHSCSAGISSVRLIR